MDLQTVPDVPLLVTVPSTAKEAAPHLSAERRISPSWTVAQLKAKLEPVTGIPPGSQDLRIREADGSWTTIAGEERRVGEWSLRRGGEIEVRRFVDYHILYFLEDGFFSLFFSFLMRLKSCIFLHISSSCLFSSPVVFFWDLLNISAFFLHPSIEKAIERGKRERESFCAIPKKKKKQTKHNRHAQLQPKLLFISFSIETRSPSPFFPFFS